MAEKTAEELAEEAGAELATAQKEEEVQPVVAEPKKEAVAQPSLEEVVSRVAAAMRPGLTTEQQEAELKKVEDESGFNRKQLAFISKQLPQVAASSSLGIAQELGKNRAEKALGDYAESLLPQVEEEMKKQPAHVQANPEAWQQMAWLVRGKAGDSVKPKGKTTVVVGNGGGKTVPGLTEPKGSAGGGTPKGKGKEYSDDEKTMIRIYFSGDAEAYEKSKASKRVVQDASSDVGGSAADKELHRLTGGRSV